MNNHPENHPLLLFRQLAREFLPDYLRIIEPDTAVHLLPERATFPIVDISGWEKEECNELGIVAQIPKREGGQITLLIQPELEPRGPAETAKRFGRWFLALETRLVEPFLLSVVYLRGGRPGPNLESSALSTLCSMEIVRIFYTAYGLSEARADYYLTRPEPLAWAFAAAMRPVRFSREELTAEALQRIGRSELPPERRDLLSAFVHATTKTSNLPPRV